MDNQHPATGSNTTDYQEFKIPVAGNKVKKHQVTAMHLIAGFLLIVMGLITFVTPYALGVIHSSANPVQKPQLTFINFSGLAYALFGLLLIIITTFFNKKVIQTKANFPLRILEIIAFLSILFYSLIQKWYLPAAYSGAALTGIILAYFLEKSGQAPRFILINERGIKIPGRNGDILWQNIKAVIFRHNVITVDCKDNKLFQLTFFKETINEKLPLIETFAKKNIETKAHLYQEDW